MTKTIQLRTLTDTEALAEQIAPHLKTGDVIALNGDLGAGKTTFARALIRALLATDVDVPSPTYTLVQTYAGPRFPIFHFDLYRLDTPDDVHELGWDETQSGLALIEWPERAGAYLPVWRLDMTFTISGESRMVALEPQGEDWQTRLHDFTFSP